MITNKARKSQLSKSIITMCRYGLYEEAHKLAFNSWEAGHITGDYFFFLIGYLYSAEGNLTEAKKNYSKAISANDSEGIYYYERALINFGLKLYKEAYEDKGKAYNLRYKTIMDKILFDQVDMYRLYDFTLDELANPELYMWGILEGILNTIIIAKAFDLSIVVNYEIQNEMMKVIKAVLRKSEQLLDKIHLDYSDYKEQIEGIKILEPIQLINILDPNKKYIWITERLYDLEEPLGYGSIQENILLWSTIRLNVSGFMGSKRKVTVNLSKPFMSDESKCLAGGVVDIEVIYKYISREVIK